MMGFVWEWLGVMGGCLGVVGDDGFLEGAGGREGRYCYIILLGSGTGVGVTIRS